MGLGISPRARARTSLPHSDLYIYTICHLLVEPVQRQDEEVGCPTDNEDADCNGQEDRRSETG